MGPVDGEVVSAATRDVFSAEELARCLTIATTAIVVDDRIPRPGPPALHKTGSVALFVKTTVDLVPLG